MLELLKNNQVSILFGCGLVCIVLAFFAMVINFHSIRKKQALIKSEFGVAVLVIADAINYIFMGDTSRLGIWMERISNFLIFALTIGIIYFLNGYITPLFMETGKFTKLPKRLLLGFIIPGVGFSMVVVSQFTGWYYYFDEYNQYQRGPLFMLGFVAPMITLMVLMSFVIQYREYVSREILFAIIAYGMLPLTAAVLQLFLYGVSLINLSIWLAALNLFMISLIDQNKELVRAANNDLATGLPNTFGYLHEVEKVIHYGDITQYCGYYFDIVRMSQINNKFGKSVGDRVIYKYAHTLRDLLDKDEIIGRLGGNYFVALVKKSNTDRFLKLMKDLPITIETYGKEEELHIAAVAGGYEIKSSRIAAGQILSNTASAVTYAKNVVHKPYVFLDMALEEELNRVHELEENARHGLDNHEFIPYYQPKVDSRTGKLCGAEALVRWKKDGKMISPMDFVPVMEKNGSVCDLDFYMLEQVCIDIKNWITGGIEPVRVSVNFSRKNLGNPILSEAISNVVEKYEVPKEYIQVEITETLDEYPIEYLIGVVDALHRYGISAAIDDFGTGSSSIGLLKKVKFDILKIDKSFIDYKNDTEKQLLKDIIHMAHNLGLKIVAEGVEEKEKVKELSEMNCNIIQGYVYDKPLEKIAFEKKLVDKNYVL